MKGHAICIGVGKKKRENIYLEGDVVMKRGEGGRDVETEKEKVTRPPSSRSTEGAKRPFIVAIAAH